MEENKKNIIKHKMNLPNRITLIRVILLPLIIIIPILAKINSYNNFLAKNIIIPGVLEAEYNITWCNVIVLIIFITAAITDAIDGHIARSRKLVTDFGKFLDPLADKLLVTSAMLVLLEEGRLWGWVVAIILAREFAVTGLRSIAASKGKVIAASMYGKVKTTFQMIMIILLLINNFPFSIIYIHTGIYIPMDKIIIVVATLLTIISGVDYFIKNKEVLKDM
ncbi:MAG: CDP-diacylglycerol--glycerol-3-phosphate 3-phosphatidyltransferase [Acholeplasmataceae bacterium]|nr:CDP-diacylglycerol--glycerol-3-phosphate 3-phosphatidyltransferase [Acholeplasmataceae bacterium]